MFEIEYNLKTVNKWAYCGNLKQEGFHLKFSATILGRQMLSNQVLKTLLNSSLK